MRLKAGIVALIVLAVIGAGVAWSSPSFVDVPDGGNHTNNIEAIRKASITLGCTDTTHYCPSDFVKRDQMASFLARGLGLSFGSTRNFPVANARTSVQAYCASNGVSRGSFGPGPCRPLNVLVDSIGNTGHDTDIAIGADGNPIVSYHRVDTGDLVVAHCDNPTCTGAITRTVVSTGGTDDVGSHSAIAIDVFGLPVVSHYNATDGDLYFERCLDVKCTSATETVLDSTNVVGEYSDVMVDFLPVISYYDRTNGDLRVIACLSADCVSRKTPVVLDSGGSPRDPTDVGRFTSIAWPSSTAFPVVSYFDATNDDVKTVACTTFDCAGTAPQPPVRIDDAYGETAIVRGSDDKPVIAYYKDVNNQPQLIVAQCDDATCASSSSKKQFSTPNASVTSPLALAVGTNGLPVISYWRAGDEDDIAAIGCRDRLCQTFDAGFYPVRGAAVQGLSLAIGVDGVPLIGFYDAAPVAGDLRVGRPTVF